MFFLHQFLDKVFQCNEKRNFVKQVSQITPENESPEQVRLLIFFFGGGSILQ